MLIYCHMACEVWINIALLSLVGLCRIFEMSVHASIMKKFHDISLHTEVTNIELLMLLLSAWIDGLVQDCSISITNTLEIL